MSVALADSDSNPLLCQSCIERGFNPPNPATREWQEGLFYCEDCFKALLDNLSNIAPAEIINNEIQSLEQKGPILDYIYSTFQVPLELQFDKIDKVCRNAEKIYNFHAPAVVNRDLKSLQEEIEQLGMSLFHIKYRMDPLERRIKVLKEEIRKENGLKSLDDSKEVYSKSTKKVSSTLKVSQEEKMAKTLNMSLVDYRKMMEEMQVKAKEAKIRKFNILVGNCGECGGAMPCPNHKG